VSETAQLLYVLRRIRRRARALAAIEAAAAGAAIGLGALALGAAIARARGVMVPWRAAGAIAAASVAIGAAIGATRPISLVRCARLLDAAIDRGAIARDRVLSALSFDEGATGLARAAVHDALERARAVTPSLAAPARRPRALPALGIAALALVIVGAWPARAPGARRAASPALATAPGEPRVRVATDALEAERAEVAAVAAEAEAKGDVELAAAAREARAALDALTDGALGRGEALDRLTALAARTKEGTEDSAAAQAGARAAAKAFDETAATRALGRALGAADAEKAERALADLATRAEASDGARAGIASALGAAAARVGQAANESDAASENGPRRLNRPHEASAGNGAASGGEARDRQPERRLEHLRRDLDQAANACRGGGDVCAQQLRGGAGALPRLARDAQSAEARQRLENAVRQARERLRRGELDDGSRGASERRFARSARGASPEGQRGGHDRSGSGERGEPSGDGQPGASDESMAGDTGEGAGASGDVFMQGDDGAESGSAVASASAGEAANGGDGAGKQAGGAPLGRGALPPTRGHESEVRVRGSAGPNRSEVIAASARQGFAERDYARVFDDYQPVVEESLASGAVPEGRRFVVRRYFQLIRPRAPARTTP
jgi:hypothetical protein